MANTTGRVAIVTGASSGIGKATAKTLAKEGITVVLSARRAEKLEALADEIESSGGTAFVVPADMTEEDDLTSLVETVTDEFGRIDILVNNAGFGLYGSVEETPMEDARYQFEVNVFGLARLTQLVLPTMRERGYGKIINISSMGGRIWTPMGAWYHATKHALEGWSDCLRYEVAPFGIDVVVIEPGSIKTEWSSIMVDGLLERSGNGPYADMANELADTTREAAGDGSDPQVVASAIRKAVRSNDPKARYAVGQYAKPLLAARRIGGDRVYDRVVDFMV
ncbi:SDR family NAD(P)-dependent oxidoreductase [Haloferax sp. MBLA0076]|uniref:SDR family NAD(P)-dependent oxidoreductase n=1 Tax=Haloferax litoreum TaxID=2666140 RepID=A0A6A8GDD6_9EURY|nr:MULTISPECIES: oxidoreductase [Haloferax]KAB1192325.1 SDR family NAD(P)-dependent oxidoreductase [Haloferax sp. CBA1148]MRX20786.1 SDR family NAD(P)-dependent oxidoreductase [Haloferax litoreum]